MISFIVPAHNEQAWVGRCLSAIRGAMEVVGESHEVVLVDDASTPPRGSPSSTERESSSAQNPVMNPTSNSGATLDQRVRT
jgi:cellulose synthase/poly-beta-1,6-N-acetylglucosamine synthase-like glycosyltransferase